MKGTVVLWQTFINLCIVHGNSFWWAFMHLSSWQDESKFATKLTKFKILSETEVMKIMLKSPNKYCELNPFFPTALLREYIDKILSMLTTS
jgi:hypothetical protein